MYDDTTEAVGFTMSHAMTQLLHAPRDIHYILTPRLSQLFLNIEKSCMQYIIYILLAFIAHN